MPLAYGSDGDRLLWRAPRPEPSFTVSGIAWRPDGAELAFSSDHEMATSWFERDVYVVGADGSGLRKLTNAPAACQLSVLRPGEGGQPAAKGQPGEAFFNSGAGSNYGAQFANKIAVKCP